MNRQIKFRAWCKDHDENCFHGNRMINAESWFFSDEYEPFIDSVQKAQELFEIMQFTGLYDASGVEIYEGDIVLDKEEGKAFKAVFSEKMASFIANQFVGKDFELMIWNLDYDFAATKIVIGNIYENPELFFFGTTFD